MKKLDYIKSIIKRKTKLFRDLLFFMLSSFLLLASRRQKNKELLIVKTDAIGDYFLFRNFLKFVRDSRRFKEYKITLLGNSSWKNLTIKFDSDFVDEFLFVDRDKLVKNPFYFIKKATDLRKRGFEVLLGPTYSREFAIDLLVKLIPANKKIGNYGDEYLQPKFEKSFSNKFYDELIDSKKEAVFEFERNRDFFSRLLGENLSISGPHIANNYSESETFVIFPGAGEKFRRWSPEKFARVADHIYENFGYIGLICGSRSDGELANQIVRFSKYPSKIKDKTGDTGLVELVKLISRCKILVSNETSAVHIAAATKTKTVCISNGNHFGRFNPYPKEIAQGINHVYPKEIEDRLDNPEILKRKYWKNSFLDINSIGTKKVIKNVDSLLK